jgi:hypothetical protein
MGWTTIPGYTKRQVINELTNNDYVHKHKLVGNELWIVEQFTNKKTGQQEKIIVLYLLDNYGGEWGYKPIDELMGPCYYGCPLEFFELAQDHVNEKWRVKARNYQGVEAVLADEEGVPA